jgi:hypothetical protein
LIAKKASRLFVLLASASHSPDVASTRWCMILSTLPQTVFPTMAAWLCSTIAVQRRRTAVQYPAIAVHCRRIPIQCPAAAMRGCASPEVLRAYPLPRSTPPDITTRWPCCQARAFLPFWAMSLWLRHWAMPRVALPLDRAVWTLPLLDISARAFGNVRIEAGMAEVVTDKKVSHFFVLFACLGPAGRSG